MNKVVEINWGSFRAKFDKKEQETFEWLCSLLFYKEHGQPTGALRYHNQAGIEADPITVGQDVIGWQAKFIDTRLSEKRKDLIDAIDNAKEENPELTRIVFYLNKDFSASSKPAIKDPAYKVEVENHAKAKGVQVDWRTAGFFETPFVCEENANIARHFFTSDEKSIIDLIQELSRHTAAILKPIRSKIQFGETGITIDRSDFLATLRRTLTRSPLVVISGEAGVGKTAVIKDFYDEVRDSLPFFVFKANELNISNVNQLFKDYGDFTLSDVVKEFHGVDEKYVVIDSAEKLADIEYPEVFLEFLSTLTSEGWKIVFTTRLSYLDDLRNNFLHIYSVVFEPLNIPPLTGEELLTLAERFQFAIPDSDRLQRLLQTPFFLNEYLQYYPAGDAAIGFSEFKEALWNKQVANSSYKKNNMHRQREDCFIDIARKRASEGHFFVTVDRCDEEVLRRLESDDIIKFDNNSRAYFITHDIYEEWALDRIIEQAYRNAQQQEEFFSDIGDSLAIRRAFRSWVSEKLASQDADVMAFVESTIRSDTVQRHWKTEALVAILLSEHAGTFIEHFDRKLCQLPEQEVEDGGSSQVARLLSVTYRYEDTLLYRILFLLRIACKEPDQEFLKLHGISNIGSVAPSTLFTKPKGQGWKSVIAFINKHKDVFGLHYMTFILPVLDDWTRNNKTGATTRHAGQIALFYYNTLTEEDGFYFSSHDKTKEILIRTIFNASAEIKSELSEIFNKIVLNKKSSRTDRYYDLAYAALSALSDSAAVATNLPLDVLKLADLFWADTPEESGDWYRDGRSDIEQYFNLPSVHHDYYPASAFQTPIFRLLQVAPKETVDFILSLTNRSIEFFAKSDFARYEAKEINVIVDDAGATINQYICNRVWNIYRGTQVAPDLLESVHMALERWLLMNAKNQSPDVVEAWCLYLLRNSFSASISAILVSIVLSQSAKLFNLAQILFRTKEFFLYDTARLQLDMQAKSTYAISHYPSGLHIKERMETCEDKHRSQSLERLVLTYQLFSNEGESDEIVKHRQETIWNIFDSYYAQLPDKTEETEADKTWRLYLARMDRRKMNIKTEKMNNQVIVNFEPDIDPELRKFSNDAIAENEEMMKYMPLKLWAQERFERRQKEYKKYQQYETEHKQVISEIREILEGLRTDDSDQKTFSLFYHSVPAYACGVLTRDFFPILDDGERRFCKDVIMEYASLPLQEGYQYQIGDGVEPTIMTLPILLCNCSENTRDIKRTLFFTLFNSYPVGMGGGQLSDYAVVAILQHLWEKSPVDANSLFLGYLLLKPRLEEIIEAERMESCQRGDFQFSVQAAFDRFVRENDVDIKRILANELSYKDISTVSASDPNVLVTAFRLLPLGTEDSTHKQFVRESVQTISKVLAEDDRQNRLNYGLSHRFLEKFSQFVLMSSVNEIGSYLEPVIADFAHFRHPENIFSEFINAQDALNRYEQFWTIWNLFYPKILELHNNGRFRRNGKGVIYTYLLAWPYWHKDAKEWHSLKEKDKPFFERVVADMGDNPAVLYSISKLLNDIGSGFIDDGIAWLSKMIDKNPNLFTADLEVNTVYYMEAIVRGYSLQKRHKIRTNLQLKRHMLVILDFLIERGSVTGYMVREDIL